LYGSSLSNTIDRFHCEKVANEAGNRACNSEIARNHAWRARCIGKIGSTA